MEGRVNNRVVDGAETKLDQNRVGLKLVNFADQKATPSVDFHRRSFNCQGNVSIVHFLDIYNFKIFRTENWLPRFSLSLSLDIRIVAIFHVLLLQEFLFSFDKYVMYENRDWNARCLKTFSIFFFFILLEIRGKFNSEK